MRQRDDGRADAPAAQSSGADRLSRAGAGATTASLPPTAAGPVQRAVQADAGDMVPTAGATSTLDGAAPTGDDPFGFHLLGSADTNGTASPSPDGDGAASPAHGADDAQTPTPDTAADGAGVRGARPAVQRKPARRQRRKPAAAADAPSAEPITAATELGAAAQAVVEAAGMVSLISGSGRFDEGAVNRLRGTLKALGGVVFRDARPRPEDAAAIKAALVSARGAASAIGFVGARGRHANELVILVGNIDRQGAASAAQSVEAPKALTAKVARTLERLERVRELAAPYAKVDQAGLAAAIAQTHEWQASLAGPGASAAARRLATVVPFQHDVVRSADKDLAKVLADPAIADRGHVVAAFVRAMATAADPAHGKGVLAWARNERDRQLLRTAEATLTAAGDDVTALGAAKIDARSGQRPIEHQIDQLDARLIAGGAVDDMVLRETLVSAREHAFRTAMHAVEVRALQLADACAAANRGLIAKAANHWDDDIKKLPGELRQLAKVPHTFRNEYRHRTAMAHHAPDGVADTRAARLARLTTRTDALDAIEPEARAWAADGYFQERLKFAEAELRDSQIRTLVLSLAATVAQVMIGNFAGAAVRNLTQAAMVGRGAAVTELVVGGAALATDVGLSTAFQKGVMGDDASLLTLAGLNVASAAVGHLIEGGFRGLSTVERDAAANAALWERLAAKEQVLAGAGMRQAATTGERTVTTGATISTHMLAGAAVDYAARKVAGTHAQAPGDQSATDWLLQGAAMGLGRFIGARLQVHADRSFRGVRDNVLAARTETLVARAQEIETTGNIEAANALIGEYRALLDLERAQLDARLAEYADRGREPSGSLAADLGANSRATAHVTAAAEQVPRARPSPHPMGTLGEAAPPAADLATDPRVTAAAAGKYVAKAGDLHDLHGAPRGDGEVSPIHVDAVAGRAHFEIRHGDTVTRVEAPLPPAIGSAASLKAHANRIVGRPVASIHEGHQILRDANRGDLAALARVGVDVPPGTKLEGIEFGLGALADGSFVVIRGEHAAVDWGELPGITPIAHTHPLMDGNHPRVVGEDQIALVNTVAATAEPLVSREIVFPSAADVTMMGRRNVKEHLVITDLVVHQGAAAPPEAGRNAARLEWTIVEPVKVGTHPTLGDIYQAHLIGDVNGRPVIQHDVWANEPPGGIGNLYMQSPMPTAAPAAPAPPTPAQRAHLTQRKGELTAAVAGKLERVGRVDLDVLTLEEFAARFRSEQGRAVLVMDGDQPRVVVREDATAAQVDHELDHVAQLKGPMGESIRRLHAGGLDEWDQRSIRDRIELLRTKLAIEIDATLRRIAEESASGADPAEATETLAGLRTIEAEVASFDDATVAELSAGRRQVPDYLEHPAWLFSKAKATRGPRPDLARIDTAPRAVLPREGKERSAAWDTRADVQGVYRIGNEWREVVDVTADHAGVVSVRDDGAGKLTILVTDASGKAHPYALEPGAVVSVNDGDKVAPGNPLAVERDRRYRLVEIDHATGKDHREEVFSSAGHWMQRGSESTRRGAIMEEAARRQVDARLAEAGVAKVPAGGATEGYRRINHQRGGGGFDDVVVIFSGTADEPKAFIRIREVKDYPNRHVPLEEFSAIRPPGLMANVEVLRLTAAEAVEALQNDRAPPAGFEGLTAAQAKAVRDAVDANSLQIEIVVGPTTRLGHENAPGASVLSTLRSEIRGQLNGADVLARSEGGLDPDSERVAPSFAHGAATAASERKP